MQAVRERHKFTTVASANIRFLSAVLIPAEHFSSFIGIPSGYITFISSFLVDNL